MVEKTLIELLPDELKKDGLNGAENVLLRRVLNGDIVVYTSFDIFKNICRYSNAARSDDSEQTIRAELIKWLCTEKNLVNRVSAKGIFIHGALISGLLDFHAEEIHCQLVLQDCKILDGVMLSNGISKAISFERSKLSYLSASKLKVNGNLVLRGISIPNGVIDLRGAVVNGSLNCRNAHIENSKEYAFVADNLNVEGNLTLGYGLTIIGGVILHNAVIKGKLDCCEGEFHRNNSKYPLSADGIIVKGGIFFRKSKARGEIRFINAKVEGGIEFDGSNFDNLGGIALNAHKLSTQGNLFLRNKFIATGSIILNASTINGELDFSDATFNGEVNICNVFVANNLVCCLGTFINRFNCAIRADRIVVNGGLFLNNKIVVLGEISLIGGRIKNHMFCSGIFINIAERDGLPSVL